MIRSILTTTAEIALAALTLPILAVGIIITARIRQTGRSAVGFRR